MAETRKGFEKYFQKLFNNNIFKTSKEDQKKSKNEDQKNEAKNSSLIEKINLRKGNIVSDSLVVGGSFHFRVKSI